MFSRELLEGHAHARLAGGVPADGAVNLEDLLMVLASWGECAPEEDCPADVNNDGMVDVEDLLIVLTQWA